VSSEISSRTLFGSNRRHIRKLLVTSGNSGIRGDMSLANAAPPSSARVRAPSRLIARTPSATGRHRRRVVVRGSSTKADEAGAPATVEQRKRRLVQLCARTDRGKSATPEVAAEIESIVAALEAVNPTKDPAVNKELLTGKWSLLYTGASAEDAAKRAELEGAIGSALTEVSGSSGNVAKKRDDDDDVVAGSSSDGGGGGGGGGLGEEEKGGDAKPMGRTISTFSGDAVDNRGNFQDIDAFKGDVLNRAELAAFGVPLEVEIVASCTAVDPRRLAVAFRKVRVTLGSLPTLTIPLGWVNDGRGPEGWLDTTYLDDDMRLGRGDKGSTFVTVRRK